MRGQAESLAEASFSIQQLVANSNLKPVTGSKEKAFWKFWGRTLPLQRHGLTSVHLKAHCREWQRHVSCFSMASAAEAGAENMVARMIIDGIRD